MSRRSAAKLAALLALASPPAPHAATPEASLSGLTIEQSISRFADNGLRIYFSSDLVRSSMKVEAAPTATDPVDALAQILAPHGLMLRPGLNDSWLVVRRAPSRRAPEVRSVPSAGPSDGGRDIFPRPVEEVVVSASRYEIQGAHTAPPRTLSDIDLEHAPDLGDDAIRAVARLPGMASNGFSALANVRGGEIRETLVRLDGLSLHDPFHLKDFQGVFSVIDPRVVSSMDVYTGGFPARFGDRMSGVIDVETISPPDDLYHEIGLSFFNSSILSAGRFLDSRGQWVASARRSNLDLLYDRFSDQPERPRYTDAFAKLGFDINDRLSMTGNVLRATDDIALADDVDREERASASQTGSYGWLTFDHRLGGRTSGTTLLASTAIDTRRGGTSEKTGVSSGALSDDRSYSVRTLRSEWTRIVGARLMLDFGAEVSSMRGRYDYEDQVEFDLLFDVDGAPAVARRTRTAGASPRGRRYSLYTDLRLEASRRVAVEVGARWTEQVIDDVSHGTREPRLGVRYAVSGSSALRASWGRFYQAQGIHELQVNDGLTRFFPPQRSDHFVLGFDRQLAGGGILRIEGYEKTMTDLWPRFENLLNSRVLLPELKPDRIRLAPERARARGVEVSLDGQSGALYWWGSIGWARVEDDLPEGTALRSWDQTYTLNGGLQLDLDRWNLSTGLVYRSGWPTTPVVLDDAVPFPTVTVSRRNSDRLGAYASLDIRLSRAIAFDQSELTVFVEIANVSGRSNPCCIEYEVGDEEDAGLLVLDERYYLPTIPSVGFTWTF